MQIRRCQLSDLERVCAIGNDVIRQSPANFRIAPEQIADMRARFERDRECYPWLVASEGPEILGYCYASAFRPKEAYAWTAETTVYLAESARGRGVGQRLYGSLLEILKRQGFQLAMAAITRPNAASERLHESFGFRTLGAFTRVGYKFDTWWDVAFVQRVLNEDSVPPKILSVSEVLGER